MGSYCRQLDEALGGDYLDLLLTKVASLYGVPRKRIVINSEGNCWSKAYADSPIYYHSGLECAFGGSNAPITPEDQQRLLKVRRASLAQVDDPVIPRLMDGFRADLEKFFQGKGGTLSVLDQDGEYLEIVVRGLQGVVVAGSKQWERIDIAVFYPNRPSGSTLRIEIDGNWGSGIVAPSTDKGYDHPLQPEFSGALNEFAKQLSVLLRHVN
jgi:hypothetical protein